MKHLIIIIVFALQLTAINGQNCDCLENFDFLVDKLSKDYAGFQDKVNNSNRKEYNKFILAYRNQAKQIHSLKRCELLLSKWLEYFNDKHLQLSITLNIYWAFKQIDPNTILFRIPSFAWEDKPRIDSLIHQNFSKLISTPILIIDLRGNGGGIDYSYQELLPLLYTNPYTSKSVSWLASDNNIKYFEDALANKRIRKGREQETLRLIDSLKAHRNSFFDMTGDEIITGDTVYKYPLKVGIIINDFCASSCEQFFLAAKGSKKTLIFGTNTLGVLDYSNSVPIDLPLKGFQIRYPMTRSNRLPDFPIDNIGIPPDVEISLPDDLNIKDGVDTWVLFVKEYLEKELLK
jgi:hypothetical protein